MVILGRSIITEFKKKHARSRKSLDMWINKCESAKWSSFSDIKKTFNSVDINGDELIFNIAGNNYRLIAVIEYVEELLIVRKVYTHDEYLRKY